MRVKFIRPNRFLILSVMCLVGVQFGKARSQIANKTSN
jgi:hypothetical protein